MVVGVVSWPVALISVSVFAVSAVFATAAAAATVVAVAVAAAAAPCVAAAAILSELVPLSVAVVAFLPTGNALESTKTNET